MSKLRALEGFAAFVRAAAALFGIAAWAACAQPSSVPSEGVHSRAPRHVLLTNARIVVQPGQVIEDGSIEIRDGRIVAVATYAGKVDGAQTRDLQGKTVFAGFIEPAARMGLPEDMRAGAIKALLPGPPPHQTTLDQAGARHWNRRVRPEWSVAERLDYKPEDAKALRALGFAAAYAMPEAGVIKGQGALLSLLDTAQDKDVLLRPNVAQHLGFELAGGFSGEYPGSLMGAIALIRQSLLDARWHRAQPESRRIEANLSLDALARVTGGDQRVFFQLDDELDVQRVTRVAREFNLDAVLIGTGFEYRVLGQVEAAKTPFVLPLAFPEAASIEDPETSLNVSLADLQHWEQAPANPARVAARGVEISLTTRATKEPDKNFWPQLRRAVRAGLSEDAALNALTVNPARLLGESGRLGRVARGQLANLVVADADLFRNDKARLYETWVEGHRFEHQALSQPEAPGIWTLAWSDGRGPIALTLEVDDDDLEATTDDGVKFKVRRDGERLTAFAPAALFGGGEGIASFRATVDGDQLIGYRDLANGQRVRVSGRRSKPKGAATEAKAADHEAPIPAFVGYPAGEYARESLPTRPPIVLVRNVTAWTNTEQGVVAAADVLVREGRIVAVGIGLDAPAGALVVDGNGRHLTPGIIDAHSHTAIARNVNEPSHAVTSEVRVGDVLDPTDIDLYRQLAGGVTSANLLHGSANPMGGQNAVIKLRWGADADGLRFDGAKPGIKFALGENVKQSGWGDAFVTRYPQTRMGVEQVMRDHFNAAREYAAARAGKDRDAVRRDLRLEALAQILAGERVVHVHSYRQDEILMFARLAKEYEIPVATFQHVLEGYKVADVIAGIGAGSSTFADWWGYKMEVLDGIPHNAALMTQAGVLTSFNSDSNEMARRLNMEAAKAMRYGGLDEQQALKLVTLNPALQLRIADRVGALQPGLDADFVLWSDHPLSNFARAEQTWIDGRKYFDRVDDVQIQGRLARERERLLRKALTARAKTLSLEPGATSKAGDAPEVPVPATVVHTGGHAAWLIENAPARSIYHSGGDLLNCAQHGH